MILLLISEKTVRRLRHFAETSCSSSLTESNELKLKIRLAHMEIIFTQQERYSKKISCLFDFGNDISFFYGDVVCAIENRLPFEIHSTYPGDALNDRCANDEYVGQVLDFFEAHLDEILEFPPSWFPRAVEIADHDTRRHFPEIADRSLTQSRALWQRWLMEAGGNPPGGAKLP